MRGDGRGPEYLIVIASSMGQAAGIGGHFDTQLYLRKPELLLKRAGFSESEWERRPSMDPTVSVFVPEARVPAFEKFLDSIRIDGEAIRYTTEVSGFFDLYFGNTNLDPKKNLITLDGEVVPYEQGGSKIASSKMKRGAPAFTYHRVHS